MREVNFCPSCGGRMVLTPRRDRSRPVCSQCGYVFYANPVLAAGTLVEKQGRIALVKRGIDPGFGLWGLPAGYVEADETTEQAAIRETREETSLEVELDGLLGVYSFGEEGDSRGVLMLYAAHALGGELAAGDDASDARFFAPDALPPENQIAFSTHREALAEWRRVSAIHIYPITEPERAAIEKLSESYSEMGSDSLSEHSGASAEILLVAADIDRPVGYLAMDRDASGREGEIRQLFVLPEYRRWGIATWLANAAIEYAAAHGIATLLTEIAAANPGMLVYLKSGFRICGYLDKPTANPMSPFRASLFLSYDVSAAGLTNETVFSTAPAAPLRHRPKGAPSTTS